MKMHFYFGSNYSLLFSKIHLRQEISHICLIFVCLFLLLVVIECLLIISESRDKTEPGPTF